MFVLNEEIKLEKLQPGLSRKILSYSKELMMVEVHFEKGTKMKAHKHPHLQISYVVKGSFEFTVNGETKVIKSGDSVYMNADEIHCVEALEDGVVVDVFNPMREDFI